MFSDIEGLDIIKLCLCLALHSLFCIKRYLNYAILHQVYYVIANDMLLYSKKPEQSKKTYNTISIVIDE